MGAFRYIAAGVLGLSSLVGNSYADNPKAVDPIVETPLSALVASYTPITESRQNVKTTDEKVIVESLEYRGTSRGLTIVDAKITDSTSEVPSKIGVHLVDAPYARGRFRVFQFTKDEKEGRSYYLVPGKSELDDTEEVRVFGTTFTSFMLGGPLEEIVWEKKADQDVLPKTSEEYPKTRELMQKYADLVRFEDYIKRTVPKNIEPLVRALPNDFSRADLTAALYWKAVPSVFDVGKTPLPRFSPEVTLTLPFILSEDSPITLALSDTHSSERCGIAAGFTVKSKPGIEAAPISTKAANFLLLYGDIQGVVQYVLNDGTNFNVELFDKDGDGTLDSITMGEKYKEIGFSLEGDKVVVDRAFSQMYTPATSAELFGHARKIYEHIVGTFKDEYSTLQLSNSVLKLLPKKSQ